MSKVNSSGVRDWAVPSEGSGSQWLQLLDGEHVPARLSEELAKKSIIKLLSSGAWSTLRALGIPAVRPVAGEMLSARPKQRLEKVIYSRDVYLVPRRDGRVLIGATMSEHGFNKSISHGAKIQLLESASQLLPEVRDWNIEDHWTGLRPATPDGLPILGRTSIKNLFVATGHFRNGILLAPITAQLMTDCILNDVEPPLEFSPMRFAEGVLAPCTSN